MEKYILTKNVWCQFEEAEAIEMDRRAVCLQEDWQVLIIQNYVSGELKEVEMAGKLLLLSMVRDHPHTRSTCSKWWACFCRDTLDL